MSVDVVGAQRNGASILRGCLAELAGQKQNRAKVVVRLCVIGIQTDRLLELGTRIASSSARRVGNAEVVVRGRGGRIERERALDTVRWLRPVVRRRTAGRRRRRGEADCRGRLPSVWCRPRDPRVLALRFSARASADWSAWFTGTSCSHRSPISSEVFCPQTTRAGG